jgi:RNAse (barnase) inhibitor barstar
MKQKNSFHDNPSIYSDDYQENAEIHRFLNEGFEISQELIENLDNCENILNQIKGVANLCQILV